MEIFFYFLVITLGLVIWSISAEHREKKNLIIRLKEQWGIPPVQEYSAEKYESLKVFYESLQDEVKDVDDITWNDLDMDEIFELINNTQCSIGEEYLYALLRKPCFSIKELEERDRIIQYFSTHEKERILLQMKLNFIGKFSRITVFDYLSRVDQLKPNKNLPHYLMILSLIVSIALIFVKPEVGGVLTILCIGNNIMQYYRKKSQVEHFLSVFAFICRLLDSAKDIYQADMPELSAYTSSLKEDCDKFTGFKRGAAFVTAKKASGNLIDMIFDYFRMLFHIDLIKFNSMLAFFKENRTTFNRIFKNIGLLDSMIAVASFREYLPYYSLPALNNEKKRSLNVKDLFHPLIGEPVPNSITEQSSVLITGSNASGKSTFIKTLAINAILSQTIYTSTSKSYQANCFMIYSSMALKDNLFDKESYYMVEIKSLLRILNRVNEDYPILIFIDEVLRGTNTLERIAASSRILSYLSKKNTMVFAATHDIELTQILEREYSNYHFQERIEENEVLFDYKLYVGKAVSKNAIKLLDMLKFPKEITRSAEQAAQDFLAKGEWSH